MNKISSIAKSIVLAVRELEQLALAGNHDAIGVLAYVTDDVCERLRVVKMRAELCRIAVKYEHVALDPKDGLAAVSRQLRNRLLPQGRAEIRSVYRGSYHGRDFSIVSRLDPSVEALALLTRVREVVMTLLEECAAGDALAIKVGDVSRFIWNDKDKRTCVPAWVSSPLYSKQDVVIFYAE